MKHYRSLLFFVAVFAMPAYAQSTGTLISGKRTSSPIQSSADSGMIAGDDKEFEATETQQRGLEVARATAKCAADKNTVVTINRLNAQSVEMFAKIELSYRTLLSVCLGSVQKKYGEAKLALRVSKGDHNVLSEAYLQRYGVVEQEPWSIDRYLASDHVKVPAEYQLANCLIFTHPTESKNLVLSAPFSSEELRAFEIIRPSVSECVPAGATVTLGKTWLRLRLASALYLRSAPQSPRSLTSAKKERR